MHKTNNLKEIPKVEDLDPSKAAFYFTANPFSFLTKLQKDYGDIVAFELLNNSKFIQVSNPDILKGILIENSKYFEKSVFYDSIRLFMGKGLITTEMDSDWAQQRKVVRPALMKSKIPKYIEKFRESVTLQCDAWKQESQSNKNIDLLDGVKRITYFSLMKSLFNLNDLNLLKKSYDIIKGINEFLPVNETPETMRQKPAYVSLVESYDNFLFPYIEQEKRHSNSSGSIIDAFINAEYLQTLSEKELVVYIREAIANLIFAGFDTTATALFWTLHLIAKHPELSEFVKSDIAELSKRTPEEGLWNHSEFLKLCILESLRLYPPIWFIGRISAQDVIIKNYLFPKDSHILVGPYVTHRNPRTWKSPESFNPERFRDMTTQSIFAIPGYMPFLLGPRSCIGHHFAFEELTQSLLLILKQFEIKPTETEEPVLSSAFSITPKHPCYYNFSTLK